MSAAGVTTVDRTHSSSDMWERFPEGGRLTSRPASGINARSTPPPIFMKLTPSLLAALRDQAPKITLTIDDNANVASLKIAGPNQAPSSVYEGSIQTEPSMFEVYFPQSHHNYACAGNIRHRITLRPPSASPPQSGEVQSNSKTTQDHTGTSTTSSTPSELERVMHLLALGPTTPGSLANRLQIGLQIVQAILSRIAEPTGPRGADLFNLKPEEFRHLRIAEWKHYSAKERKLVTENAERAGATKQPPSVASKSTDSKANGTAKSKPKSSDGSNTPTDTTTGSKSTTKLSQDSREARPKIGASAKRKSELEVPPKRKKVDGEEDMFALARRFRESYGEYRELYSTLAKRKTRAPPSQVQRLLVMHKELERWKRVLWSNSRHHKHVAQH